MARAKQSNQPVRVNLDMDPTVRAFQFTRAWARRDGTPITNQSGTQVRTASPILKGGAWTEDYSLAQLNADIAADKVTAFVNNGVTVYRINPKPRPRQNQLAIAE